MRLTMFSEDDLQRIFHPPYYEISAIVGTQNVGGIDYPIYGIQHGDAGNDFYGYAGDMGEWQFGFESSLPANEEIADMFVGWVYGNWGGRLNDTASLAYQRMNHMATFMPVYLGR
jgi:hypothetical protein